VVLINGKPITVDVGVSPQNYLFCLRRGKSQSEAPGLPDRRRLLRPIIGGFPWLGFICQKRL